MLTGGSDWTSPDISAGLWMAAAAGPDLVIVSEPGEEIEPLTAAIRTPDGSVRPLPPVPFRGQLKLVSRVIRLAHVRRLDPGSEEPRG